MDKHYSRERVRFTRLITYGYKPELLQIKLSSSVHNKDINIKYIASYFIIIVAKYNASKYKLHSYTS